MAAICHHSLKLVVDYSEYMPIICNPSNMFHKVHITISSLHIYLVIYH